VRVARDEGGADLGQEIVAVKERINRHRTGSSRELLLTDSRIVEYGPQPELWLLRHVAISSIEIDAAFASLADTGSALNPSASGSSYQRRLSQCAARSSARCRGRAFDPSRQSRKRDWTCSR